MNKFKLLCAAAAILTPAVSFVAPAAYAQEITASVNGQVTGAGGAPIGGATVTITDTRTGAERSLTTGDDGNFSAQGLITGGPYTITAAAPGHQGQTINDVNLSIQGATELTFALDPAAAGAEENIVVTAQRVNVQLQAVGPGTAFSQTVLQNAPTFNRDVRDVIRIDPRVSLDREDVGTGGSGADRISCLGGNDRGNSFTVDGITQSDVYGLNDTGFSSRSSTPIPYDAVRETQVQFAPFDVEYGQFTGCAINVVTRSGGNRFHGDAFFEYSNNDLRGDSVDGRPVGPIEADKRWGVALGGPIFRDRLFFFAAYEHQEAGSSQDDGPVGGGFANEVEGVTIEQFNQISDILNNVYGIETGPPPTSRPFENDRWFGRIDWQITDDHRLELTYQKLEELTVRTDDFFLGSQPQVTGLNTFYNSGTDSHYYSARLYSQWTDNLSTEFRYSRSDITDIQDPVGGGEAQTANPIPRIIVGIDNVQSVPPLPSDPPDATILAGPGTSRSANDLQTQVDLFKGVVNFETGDHQFKFGVEANRTSIFNLFVQNATGTLVFRNAADLAAGLLSPGTGNNNTFTTPFNVITGSTEGAFGNFSRTGEITDAAAQFGRTIYSVYLQDEWSVSDRLDLVLGIRTDLFSGSRPAVNNNYIARYGFPNTTGFSDIEPVFLPRIGFTFDAGDFAFFRRAELRGGVGMFSGGDPVVWFGNVFQNNGFGFAEGTSQSAACASPPPAQIDVVIGGVFTGVPACIRGDGIARAAAGLGDTQSVDPDIDLPTVLRANIGFRSELNFADTGFFSGWQLHLDYIYSRYQNPFTIVDLSQTPNPALGLNGFTIDGRPIYRAIDPTVAGCDAVLVDINPTPVWQGVTAPCFNTSRDDELMLTNADSYSSHVASFILSKNIEGGILTSGGSSYFTIGYAFTEARDRRNMFNSTAGSNYDLTAAFDRQNPDVSRGFYGSRHNFTFAANFTEEFLTDLRTRFGFTFVARSGRPYSLTFAGGAVFNDSASGTANALLYVPTGANDPNVSPISNMAAVQQLADFAASLNCARRFAGRTIPRNTCSNDWYYDLDLSFSQELPGPGRLIGIGGMEDTIQLYVMFDNFLNFLDDSWNIQRRRNFAGLQDVASLSTAGVDAQGRYIITGFNGVEDFDRDNFINVSSSVWRIKVGISYEF